MKGYPHVQLAVSVFERAQRAFAFVRVRVRCLRMRLRCACSAIAEKANPFRTTADPSMATAGLSVLVAGAGGILHGHQCYALSALHG